MKHNLKESIRPSPLKKKNQTGFTLIELMIVVAIIGILASIALPAYQTYVAKSTIASIQTTASSYKTAIFEYYVENGEMPTAQAATNTDQISSLASAIKSTAGEGTVVRLFRTNPTKFLAKVTIDGINGNINGATIWFNYIDYNDKLFFVCDVVRGIPDKYLPKECRRSYHKFTGDG